MNSKWTKKIFIPFLILSMICSSLTVMASSKANRIRATLDPSYRYTVNNESILDNESTIIYKGKLYAPVEQFSNALGYNVNVRGNRVALTTQSSTPSKPTPPKPTPTQDVTIPVATIIAIDFAGKTVTIVPEGKSIDMQNQIVLNVTDQTTITDGKTKKAYSLQDLNTNMKVKVVHSAAMTKSIPPQTQAISITIL